VVESVQEIRQQLEDLHGLASTTSDQSDSNVARSLAEDQTAQLQMAAEATGDLQLCEEAAAVLEVFPHGDEEEHCSPRRNSVLPSEDREENCSPRRSSMFLAEDTQDHGSARKSSTVRSGDKLEHCSASRSSVAHPERRQVEPLMTPERGVDAGREAELAHAAKCSLHENGQELAPEAPGLTSQIAKKSKRRESMTLVAIDPAQIAKETAPARCNVTPRRVSITWMLRRGWSSTGGGAVPVNATPPRLRQRPRKQHENVQADHRSDHMRHSSPAQATVSSVARNAAYVLLGATCVMISVVELAWRLGPDPEPFS